jgi:hypothetical protein
MYAAPMRRIVGLVMLSGCLVHDGAQGLQPDGIRPHVAVDVELRDITVTEHTGTAVTRDKDGNVISRTETTADRVVGSERYIAHYDFLRGNQVIDEEDFYHLVGDEVSAAQIAADRASGLFYNHLGLVIFAAGCAGVVMTLATTGGAQRAGETLFGIALPLGGLMTIYGSMKVKDRVYPIEKALQAAGQPVPELGPVDQQPYAPR